jgi:anti-sigma factor ChrR (cupin superfamily)
MGNHMNVHDQLDLELGDRAALYVTGSLPSQERAEYELHLAACRVCEREVTALLEVSGDLALLAPHAAPTKDLWPRIRARIEDSPDVQVWRNWSEKAAPRAPAAGLGFTNVPLDEGAWEPTGIEGMEVRRLSVDRDNDRATFLARMAAGCAYPAHRHAGPEECYVLSGDLHIGDLTMRAGDYQRAEPGTEHPVQSTEHGCVLLLVSSLADELID